MWLNVLDTLTHSATISADTFETFVRDFPEETQQVLGRINMLFINEDEYENLVYGGAINNQIPTILKKGKKGAVYFDPDTIIEVPALSVNAVDTTGAGDVLAGAFLALRSQNIPIDESLKTAVHLASRSVTKFGVDHLYE